MLQNYGHWLMYFNNEAATKSEEGLWVWPVEFTVPNTLIMPLIGIKERWVLLRQRRYLIDPGRVTYQCDVTGKAGVYRLRPFDKGFVPMDIRDTKGDSVTSVWYQRVPLTVPKVSQYINVNYKYTSLFYDTQDAAPKSKGFILLPQLSDEGGKVDG